MRLIDADALIEKCGEWYTEEGSEEGYIGTLKQLLDKQPTIEPKQGKWIDADALAYMVTCSGDADFINKVTKLMVEAPSIETKQVKYFDEDEKVWKTGEVIVDGEREGE